MSRLLTPKQLRQNTNSSSRPGRSFNISAWSIDHPHAIAAFYVAVLLLAVLAVTTLIPRRLMPYVESPMIGIITMQPGLSAQEMETYISKPIEERMVDIKRVRYIRSSSQDGFSMVSLEFPYGTDMKRALVDVQSLMNVVQADLPVTGANLKPSWVLPIDPLNLPVLTFNLTSKSQDMATLRQLADNEITNRLKTVPHVWSVYTFGGFKRQLQVNVDRNKLAAFGLSILDVKAALDRNNVARPAGRLTDGSSEAIIRIDTLAKGETSVADYPVKAVDGKIVYIKDLARVEDTVVEQRAEYHHVSAGGIVPGIEVSVIQEPDASSPEVTAGVMKVIAALKKEHSDLDFTVSYDNSHFVGILMHNMIAELVAAIFLTGLAVFFFLGTWRGTLISMITIPVSMAMSVLALIPMGMTLDSSTMIGLLLAIGRLVDDSIIDIHAIEQNLQAGKDPRTATVDGITSMRLPVAASTLVLVLALVPLLICGGIVQQMFVGLVWPIIFGLLASFFVSLTLTPVLAARLLVTADQDEITTHWLGRLIKAKLLDPFHRFLNRLEHAYARTITWMLANRFANMARILCTIIIGFTFYNFIGSEMMPLADIGQAYGQLEVSPGASFAETRRITTAIEAIMLKHPEIQHVSTEIGFDPGGAYFNGYSMQSVNNATFMITLSDKDKRQNDIWQVIDSVQAEAMAKIPGIRRFSIKEMGSDVMATSQAPISLLVTGKDPAILSKLSDQVAAIARQTRGMHQVSTDWSLSKPGYDLQVDPRRAAELGLTADAISEQAYYALTGALTSEYYRLPNLRQRTVQLRLDEPQRAKPEDLMQMTITGANGVAVPLKTVATMASVTTANLVNHDQMRRAVTVMGFYRKNEPPSMDVSMDVMGRAMSELNWPPGYSLEVRGDMTQMMDSFARLLSGLQLSVLLIFLLLVAQFRGFLQPLQMVFSLPLELAGIFVALFAAHQAFSSVSIMAVIIVTGMDITTAILLIDRIMRLRSSGMERNQAIIQACPERLRPILMTSVITVLVMLPVALAPKTGMDAYAPLGTVVIGGLLVGTVLSLFDIPLMHSYVDDLKNWCQKLWHQKHENDKSATDTQVNQALR